MVSNRNRSALRKAAVALTTVACTLAGSAGTASATTGRAGTTAPAVSSDPHVMACGYYETRTDAFYGHCGPGIVKIQIDIDWWPTDILRCVSPGETHLGTTGQIDDAWYIGLC